MKNRRKLFWAKTAVIFGAIPMLIWAYEYGPDAGYSGVPGEAGTCATAGCHTGTVNSFSGSVKVAFPNGATYTPGVNQHLVVTIADAAQRAWGFQLTARPSASSSTLAGSFASTDANTTMMCASANLRNQVEVPFKSGSAQSCPAGMPLQYIEHSLAGYNASKGHTGSQTYEFDWTPPATDVGDVVVYVSGNAANGDLTNNGDHIYNTKFTLTAAAAGTPPSISSGGVVSAAAFGSFPSIAPGTWIEIYGSNLSATTRQWAGTDFTGSTAPNSLDNVKVTVGGQLAFVDYISPTQVNAQVPSSVASGPAQLTVSNPAGTSAAYAITVNNLQPGLLAPPSFSVGGKQYVVAQHLDNTYVLPPNAIAGLTTRQAKPGETIIIYGIGFGPAINTATNANIPAGQIVSAANQLTNTMQMQVNGVTANLAYFGLAPNFVGLYQFNMVVPTVPDNDAWPLTFTVGGIKNSQTLYLAVHQ